MKYVVVIHREKPHPHPKKPSSALLPNSAQWTEHPQGDIRTSQWPSQPVFLIKSILSLTWPKKEWPHNWAPPRGPKKTSLCGSEGWIQHINSKYRYHAFRWIQEKQRMRKKHHWDLRIFESTYYTSTQKKRGRKQGNREMGEGISWGGVQAGMPRSRTKRSICRSNNNFENNLTYYPLWIKTRRRKKTRNRNYHAPPSLTCPPPMPHVSSLAQRTE